MRFFRRKAADPSGIQEPLIRTGLGGSAYSMESMKRVATAALVQRYGRWVQRCVSINAQAAASIPARLFLVGGSADIVRRSKWGRAVDTKTMEYLRGRGSSSPGVEVKKAMGAVGDDVTELIEHPVLTLLNDVNEQDGAFSYNEALYSDLQIAGRYFGLLITENDSATEPPTSMWRSMPQYTRAIPGGADGFVKGFEYKVGVNSTFYRPDEMFWVKMFDPSDPWGGYGPLEGWLKSVDADWAMVAFQEWMFNRGGSPDYVVVSKDNAMGDPQKKAFKSEWRRLFGKLARRQTSLAFATGDISFQKLQDTMRDLEFPKGREMSRDEIGQAFGVPKPLLTSDDVNRANADAAMIQLMRLTVWPMVLRVQERMNQNLLPRWSDRLLLVHDNPIPEDMAIVIQDRESKLRSGYSFNEVRRAEGEPTLDDPAADVPMMAAGLVPMGTLPPSPFPSLPPQPDDETDDETESKAKQTEEIVSNRKAIVSDRKQSETVVSMKAWHLEGDAPCSCHKTTADGDSARGGFDDRENPDMAKPIEAEMRSKLEGVESRVAASGDSVDVADVMGDSDDWAKDLAAVVNAPVATVVEVAGSGAIQAVSSGLSFDMQNRRAIDYVKDTSRRIGNQTTDTFRGQIASAIEKGLENGESAAQVAKRVAAIDDLLERKAMMIARTETAFATVEGSVQGWEQSGVVVGKKWLLAPDACEFCRSVANEYNEKVLDLRKEFKPLGSRVQSADDPTKFLAVDYVPINGPPLHPNDRCDMVPVLDDE